MVQCDWQMRLFAKLRTTVSTQLARLFSIQLAYHTFTSGYKIRKKGVSVRFTGAAFDKLYNPKKTESFAMAVQNGKLPRPYTTAMQRP